MANQFHFASIGLGVDSRDEFVALVDRLIAEADKRETTSARVMSYYWTDGDAECWIHPSPACAVPGFRQGLPRMANVDRWFDASDGCPNCAVVGLHLPDDGPERGPLILTAATGNAPALRESWQKGASVEIALSGFVESARVRADESPEGSEPAGSWFYPLGPYAAQSKHRDDKPRALASGASVIDVSDKKNAFTGAPYEVVAVRTYGFERLPLLWAGDLPAVRPGDRIDAYLWMYGATG